VELPYSIVNSFTVTDPQTAKQVGGNAAAIIFLEDKDQLADQAQMGIAAKFPSLTEAVFVYPCPPDNAADFGMRYWSPQRQCEYAITGHPTIAAACAMLFHDHNSLAADKTEYVLETKAGLVSLSINKHDSKVFMGQIQPVFQDVPVEMEEEVHEIFNLKQGDIISPIKAVNMGLGYFIFKVRDIDVLMRMKRDLPKLIEANKRFGLNGGAQPYADLPDSEYDLRTRNLDLRAPNQEGRWLEDSACGQGTASLMAYLMAYMNHTGAPTRIQQGVLSEPCCVDAFGKRDGKKLDIFIGGTSLEKETGTLTIESNRANPSNIHLSKAALSF